MTLQACAAAMHHGGEMLPPSLSGCEARAGRRLNVSRGDSIIAKLLEIRFS